MNVHDSMVVRYSADLENETFAMYLKPDTEEGVKEVNFEGVLAHWFEYVASWNVLYDIEELDVKTFTSYFKKVLLEGKSDGWPLFFETLEDFLRYVDDINDLDELGCQEELLQEYAQRKDSHPLDFVRKYLFWDKGYRAHRESKGYGEESCIIGTDACRLILL